MPSDTFLKLGDIKGESLDATHKDEIEVESFSWGVTNQGSMSSGSGGGAGKASFHELSFVHQLDRSSPVLMQGCATGTAYKEATITLRKSGKGQQEYLTIKLTEVMISGVTFNNNPLETLTENVTLAFAKVAYEYKPQKGDGSLDAGIQFKYDVKAQKEE
jgi:type VI secretion system secreted protein Hcp